MSKYYWFILSLFLSPFAILAQEPDSVRLREITTGVYSNLESISDKLLSKNAGYSFELGAYQERKLLGKVSLAYSGGCRYRSYEIESIVVDTTPITDTSIVVNYFDTNHDEISLTTSIGVKFVYVDNPKIYLLLGIGPEIRLRQKVSAAYKKTLYVDDEFLNIGESTTDPPSFEDDDFKFNPFGFRFDIGFGIELKKFDIEIVNRTNNVNGIGIRIRYKFDTLIY